MTVIDDSNREAALELLIRELAARVKVPSPDERDPEAFARDMMETLRLTNEEIQAFVRRLELYRGDLGQEGAMG